MYHDNDYIDIHAHILPGVDDGSVSMEQTIRMLHIAAQQQITTIIATPHYAVGADNPSVDHLREVKEQVQHEAYQVNKAFKILLGNEIYYSASIINALKSGDALTLAGSRYVLVEFSIKEGFQVIYRGVSELIRHGYIPILAHVERYHCLNRRDDLVNELVKTGCYIQVNCMSLVGGIWNRDAYRCRKLFYKGLVHFVGSDCHGDQLRAPMMQTAINYLHKKCDDRLPGQIFIENPVKMLKNTYI